MDSYHASADKFEAVCVLIGVLGFFAAVVIVILGVLYIDYKDHSDWEPTCPGTTRYVEWNDVSESFDICVPSN